MMKHIAIIPARNESAHIRQTLNSLLSQTVPPDRIIVVDDGSTDDTPSIVESMGAVHPSVMLIRKADRGYRKMGGGVVDTFTHGYDSCRHESFEYVSKLDADLIFPNDYFERIFGLMDADPVIASASGILFDQFPEGLERLRTPEGHVPGPLKVIRKRVFDSMGGFQAVYGWDIIDQVKMRQLGFRTVTVPDLHVIHLRPHGTAQGALEGRATWGKGAWMIGSHPLFVFARGLYRMLERPYLIGGLAFWYGYLRAAITRQPRIEDDSLIAALRREQWHRLFHGNKLEEPKRD